MADYRIVEAADPQAVLDFWRREDAMPEEIAERRVGDVRLVALDEHAAIAAVSSAYLRFNEQLRLPMWYFRVFVGASHRRHDLAERLAYAGRDQLAQAFVSGGDRRASGIVYELESLELAHAPEARWREIKFTFIGENEYGEHVRVHYFPGARAPL